MKHALSEAKIGDVFRITDIAGESRDAFFAGAYKKNGDESSTIYTFLYWSKFSQHACERLPNAPKGYKWQTSDFFLYKEDIIKASEGVLITDYSMFHSPFLWHFSSDFSIQEPWIALCGYQFETADINTCLTITKLEEYNSTQVLSEPVLPKRKEQCTNESSTKRSENRRPLSYY